MEILGGGADDEDLRLERERRARGGASKDEDGARGRKRIAASLDLGTMDLAPDAPAAYRRPPAPSPHADPHPAPHPSPFAATSTVAEWEALRRATAAGAGNPSEDAYGTGPGGTGPGGNGLAAPGGRDTLDAGPAPVELDLGEKAAEEPHPTHERDYRAGPVSAVLGAPSLALAGILVCVAGLFGGIPLLMLYTELTGSPGESATKIVSKGLAGFGVTGAVFGLAGLRRMRASTPRWVPTVAGATLLLGVVLLAVAGYFWWTGDHAVPVEDY